MDDKELCKALYDDDYYHADYNEEEDEDEESLEEYERGEYYRNVLAPQIERLNRR